MVKVPLVTLEAYLGGSRPKTVNLNSPKIKKLLAEIEAKVETEEVA